MITNSPIRLAGMDDVPALVALLNSAYRGEESKKGWTNEAHLIDGHIRSDAASVKAILEKSGSVILKYQNKNHELIGCVNLQKQEKEIYLGMFAVNPLQQGKGIGKKLLQAAEAYALSVHRYTIQMTVISLRIELTNWYKRHGYTDTGERKPFSEDGISGKHLQQLEFVVLEKQLKTKK